MKLRIHRLAVAEIDHEVEYHESCSPGLGAELDALAAEWRDEFGNDRLTRRHLSVGGHAAMLLHVTAYRRRIPMATNAAMRVQKRRAALRKAGLRPVQLWVPDTRRPSFAKECRRQSSLLRGDPQEREILAWIERAHDTEGWK